MGILNITPDSFAEATPLVKPGGRVDVGEAVEAALSMQAGGADLIDVGGESSRPGADTVTADEEIGRILPVLRALAVRIRVPLSVDTCKADVARAALDAGAAIVNDISGLLFEPALATVVAERRAALVLMHTRGRPATMMREATYSDLVGEIAAELNDRVRRAVAAGVPLDRVIVDPGIGFAKRAEHGYGVLAHLPQLVAAIDRPMIIGPSRKSFLRIAAGDRPAAERDFATAAAVTAAVLAGVHIVRVHAVAEMVQVVRVAEEVRRAAGQG